MPRDGAFTLTGADAWTKPGRRRGQRRDCLAKRDPVSVEQVNLLRVEGEADHFSDAYAAWPP
jgi:hypothetical protein